MKIETTVKLPETGLIRLKQITKLVSLCPATIWNWVKANKFPKPIKKGRCTFWRVEDIRAFIENPAKDF